MGNCSICGDPLKSFADKASRMCKPCRKKQMKLSGGIGGFKMGGNFSGSQLSGGGGNKCSHCGRMLSSTMEKNSGMCDTCRKSPGGFKDFAGGFKSCSKCGKSLFSHSEKQKGICDHCQTFKKGF